MAVSAPVESGNYTTTFFVVFHGAPPSLAHTIIMDVTPEQLRNHLVSYYTETWRSNGVAVSVAEMYSAASSSETREPQEQRDHTPTPQDEAPISFLSLRNSKMLLRVRCDDSAPKDAGLRARYADLQAFMKANPALVAKTKALVDQEIERDYLVELYDTMPVVTMSMADEVSDHQDMINSSSSAAAAHHFAAQTAGQASSSI